MDSLPFPKSSVHDDFSDNKSHMTAKYCLFLHANVVTLVFKSYL